MQTTIRRYQLYAREVTLGETKVLLKDGIIGIVVKWRNGMMTLQTINGKVEKDRAEIERVLCY